MASSSESIDFKSTGTTNETSASAIETPASEAGGKNNKGVVRAMARRGSSKTSAGTRGRRASASGSASKSRRNPRRSVSAQEMASRQRDISVAEFFQKNRHLLGFDNPRKALLTCVKEAVDNSLDACEEAGIVPEVKVRIDVIPVNGKLPPSPAQATRFKVSIKDNGPGIVPKNVGKVFAKLLYGSKFHRLRQSRGQQGIGISAAGMYGQLTTGKPVHVLTKLKNEAHAHEFTFSIDTKTNKPIEHHYEKANGSFGGEHGTMVTIELEGKYQKGRASVDEYLELTSISNPHVRMEYTAPDGETTVYDRGVMELPKPPREIKPHPLGIELGLLMKMAQDTKSRWLSGFLQEDFSRVSSRMAQDLCKAARLSDRMKPRDLVGEKAEALYRAIEGTKFMSPPTDCISPIGETAVNAGLIKTLKADFYTSVTRPPKVYRGNPFVIEVGLAYGKGDGGRNEQKKEEAEGEGHAEGEKKDNAAELARVVRFANRVPLVYQQSACAAFKAVLKTSWKNYGLTQSRGGPPQGPLVIFIHMASVWVPFTSEAKEAIAEYDEIVEEVRRALQDCGRRLGAYVRKRMKAKQEFARRNVFQRYIEEVGEACKRMKGGKLSADRLKKQLSVIAERITGGEETDRLLNKKKEPDELEGHANTVVLTEEGLKGDVPQMLAEPNGETAPEDAEEPREQAELIEGATKPTVDLSDVTVYSHGKQIGGKKKAKGKKKKGKDGELPLFNQAAASTGSKKKAKKKTKAKAAKSKKKAKKKK